ncbi:MAG: ATP-binding cassette domain-containing protein, partial [Marinilabiliales bacterium]|nr:ATP-binding cassette domain-containing protein [Marinilabiliales bacterium]
IAAVHAPGFRGQVHRHLSTGEIAYADYTADNLRFHYADFYYQQRYNLSDIPEGETVRTLLSYDPCNAVHRSLFETLLSPTVLEEKWIELSSGETRKVLLLKALLQPCALFVLDNPLTGLDRESVAKVLALFREITRRQGRSLVITTSDPFPESDCDLLIQLPAPPADQLVLPDAAELTARFTTPDHAFETIFDISGRDIYAGHRLLLNQVSWRIQRGEKWLLRGANGSGKTTLMSLLNADNPAGYSLGLTLFDRLRGSGESIWEIKAKVGFVSPEIQLYWSDDSTVRQVIQSGFTGGLYLNRRLTEAEMASYRYVLQLFHLQAAEEHFLGSLSTGDRRMAVVARALVLNPPLLILDEPFQGLDPARTTFLTRLLTHLADPARTLIQIAHRDSEILPVINRSAVIREGRLFHEEMGG